MKERVTLTKDEMQKLNEGESVQLDGFMSGSVELRPPCGDDHDWHGYDYRSDPSRLDRRCRYCGERETVKVQGSELWDAVVNSEHVTEIK